jgi:hypothetical protein
MKKIIITASIILTTSAVSSYIKSSKSEEVKPVIIEKMASDARKDISSAD